MALKIINNDPRSTVFELKTSWIPGEKHQGFFRYQLRAVPSFGASVAGYLDEVYACTLNLRLYDRGGFLLREEPVYMGKGVNENGAVTDLQANDMFQLDKSDYQEFMDGVAGRNWTITWHCPG